MVNKKTIFVRFFFKDNLIETYMQSREKFNHTENRQALLLPVFWITWKNYWSAVVRG